jgi:hypothetical protein
MLQFRTSVLFSTIIAMCLFLCPPALAADKAVDGDKVLVVLLHAQSCRSWCKEVRPVLEDIKKDYKAENVVIHELDITDDQLADTKVLAKKLVVASFIPAAMDSVPCVGIFTPERRLVGSLTGPQKKATYKKYIDRALKETKRDA